MNLQAVGPTKRVAKLHVVPILSTSEPFKLLVRYLKLNTKFTKSQGLCDYTNFMVEGRDKTAQRVLTKPRDREKPDSQEQTG